MPGTTALISISSHGKEVQARELAALLTVINCDELETVLKLLSSVSVYTLMDAWAIINNLSKIIESDRLEIIEAVRKQLQPS